ncbi:unnamed protein product, partial [Ranitomeya imitator]
MDQTPVLQHVSSASKALPAIKRRLKDKTHSLWAYLLSEQSKYQNPIFDLHSLETQPVLEPNTIYFNFKFWRNMYHQFDLLLHPRQSVPNLLLKILSENKALEDELKQLQLKIRNLSKEGKYAAPRLAKCPPKLKESSCYKKQKVLHPLQDPNRTLEGSTTEDNRYTDYSQEISKAEPSIVSLEFGVAKMRVPVAERPAMTSRSCDCDFITGPAQQGLAMTSRSCDRDVITGPALIPTLGPEAAVNYKGSLGKDGNQGKHRITKRGPALSNPMFTLVTGIVGRWRA